MISGGVPSAPHRLHVVTFFSSWMDFDLFDVTRSRPLITLLTEPSRFCRMLHFLSALTQPDHCFHRSRTTGPVRRECPALSVTRTLHRQRRVCKLSPALPVLSRARSSFSRQASRVSSLRPDTIV